MPTRILTGLLALTTAVLIMVGIASPAEAATRAQKLRSPPHGLSPPPPAAQPGTPPG